MKNLILEYVRLFRVVQRANREGRTDELMQTLKKNNEIQTTMMRPKRSETINGAGELGWGAAMLCFAFSSYVSAVRLNSLWRSVISALFLLGAISAMPLCRWAIKKYITSPRTGYVAFRRDRKFWIMMVVTFAVAAGISIGLTRLMRPEIVQMAQSQARHAVAANSVPDSPGTLGSNGRLMLAIMVSSGAILYLMMNAISIREHRWKWLLLVILALGPLVICYLVPGSFIEVSPPVMLFLGLVWFMSGGATLVSFARHTQPLVPEAR
jgi:hypothetical protein